MKQTLSKAVFAILMAIVILVAASVILREQPHTASRDEHAANNVDTHTSQPLLALFDEVGLYQKNGLVEIYGADLRQRHSGPISIARSILIFRDDVACLFWSPDFSPASGATHVQVRLAEKGSAGGFTIGFILKDGTTHSFSTEPDSEARWPAAVPAELSAPLRSVASRTALTETASGAFSAPLPPDVVKLLSGAGGNKAIRTLFVIVNRGNADEIAFARIALVKTGATPNTSATRIRLSGQVVDGPLPPGSKVTLLTQAGSRSEHLLSLDREFAFADVPAGMPVSVRLEKNGREYYSTLGRWFVSHDDRGDLEISLVPLYVNRDGHPADPSRAKFIAIAKALPHGAFYEPHSRQFWPGISKPQEFESTTFSNNAGYIDRDRFIDNPDNCFRVVHLGSSNAVALQVRPFEKYNMVMESELAVRLQRCVEVISAGRDNGDIGSNYPRIRDYAVNFRPVAILLENSSSLMMQLTPLLLKKTIGWDHANNALDNFYFDSQSQLRFRTGVQDYGVYATKPDPTPLEPGIPLHLSLQVPMEHMPQPGKEAFRYLGAIMDYLRREHPEQKFVIHTALDEVTQCRTQCETRLQLADGRPIDAGASIFLKSMREICQAHKLLCFFPSGSADYRTPERYLTFEQDAHYSVLGHQWLAGEFSRFLLGMATPDTSRDQR